MRARPHYLEGMSRSLRGFIRLARGDVSGALDDGAKDLAQWRGTNDPQAIVPALGVNAYFAIETGSADTAQSLLAEFIELRKGLGGTPGFAASSPVVWAAIGAGYADEFRDAVRASRPLALGGSCGGDARRRVGRAAAMYERIGSRPSAAFARLRGAEDLASSGRRSEADRELAEALAFYRSVGATRFLRQGEALLSASA